MLFYRSNREVIMTIPTTVEKFGGAYKITSIPDELQIIHRGRAEHFEIVPKKDMPLETFQNLLNQVKTEKIP